MCFYLAAGASILAAAARSGRRRYPRRKRMLNVSLAASYTSDAYIAWLTESTEAEDKELIQALVHKVNGMRGDEAAWIVVEDAARDVANSVEKQARQENQTLNEILGPAIAGTVERSVQAAIAGGLREEDLRAALRTPAVEKALGAVLKDGIFEFINNVDFLGRAIESVPILGPIRKQVADGLRKETDRMLGQQINGFLGRYSRVAAERTLLPWISAKENRATISESAIKLSQFVFSRKVKDLVPPPETSQALKTESIAMMKEIDVDKIEEALTYGRELLHTEPFRRDNPSLKAGLEPIIAVLDKQLKRYQR